MTDLSVKDFRAHLKDYLDRVIEGEVFTFRDGHIHIAADSSCEEHLAEDRAPQLFPEA